MGNELKLSKIGNIRIKLHRPIEGKIKTCTLLKNAAGSWDVSFSCEVEMQPQLPKDEAIGIDVASYAFCNVVEWAKHS